MEPPVILTVTRALVVLRHLRKSPYPPPPELGKFASPRKVFIIVRLDLATKIYRKGHNLVLSFPEAKIRTQTSLFYVTCGVHQIATTQLSKETMSRAVQGMTPGQ